MARYLTYIHERFPLIPAALFSCLFANACIKYSTLGDSGQYVVPTIVGSLMIFLFLLRIRLWDEMKDAQFDKVHFESRPIPRGLISLVEVRTAAAIVLALEILLQIIFFHPVSFTLYLALLGYSFLMNKNFYVREFEKRNLAVYILLHQLVFVPYAYYIMTLSHGPVPYRSTMVAFFLSVFCGPYIFEIGRKCVHRISTTGTTTNDTYVARWGEGRSLIFLSVLLVVQWVSTAAVHETMNLFLIADAVLIFLCIGALMTARRAVIRFVPTASSMLALIGLIGLNLSFYVAG